MSKYFIEDPELGKIFVTVNSRSKRFIFKIKAGNICATMPPSCTVKDLEHAINNCRVGLSKMKQNGEARKLKTMIHPDRKLRTRSTEILISVEKRSDFLSTHSQGFYKICCPYNTDFSKESVQQILHNSICRLLRFEAKKYLPIRLNELALNFRLEVSGVAINSSRTRWGSCSSSKKINLSLYMMLLPDHLIDYILLHELCHTVEMNHSDKFWKLLDKYSNGKSDELKRELKNYRTDIESH